MTRDVPRSGVPVAVLDIRDVDVMTPDGRQAVANWLRKQADGVIADGDNYAEQFRATYNIGAGADG